MLYELVNPSDRVTIDAPDLQTARLACLLAGGGMYGLKAEDDSETNMPVFLFGVTEQGLKAHNLDIEAFSKDPAQMLKVADALDSALVVSLANRKALLAATKGDPEAATLWNEEKRTSMNNICATTRTLAKSLRIRASKVPT